MFTIHDRGARLCDGLNRRELLQVGGLGIAGLSLPSLLQASSDASRATNGMFGRAKNVIFLYLTGGPPQHETFDPKPDAPAEIRGPFNPITTNVPGTHFCELLPRTARIADKLAVVRSMATDDNTHSSSGSWVLTGYKYQGPNPRTIQPTDWPYLGSIVKRYRPSEELPALSTVWLPDVNRLNESVTPAGQTGGVMGAQWNPEVFVGDPSSPEYQIEGLQPRGIPPLRLRGRQTLLTQLQDHFRSADSANSVGVFNAYQAQAFDLMTSGKARQAFDIGAEPDTVRERYGKNRWGQCVLLARRLIEAGVRLVHVQWPREPGDNAVDNPLWDTHAQNHDRVEDVLCPMFDVGYTALIEDLDQRGLLDETLVVAIGEFGRTPKINAKSGRDHWGPVFSFALAGAGISGGQVYGSSDKDGGYPRSDRVEPGDLTATIFHLLGLDHRRTFTDLQGRELALTGGEPIYKLLGSTPATLSRVESTGDVARVPVFDPDRLLVDPTFVAKEVLRSVESPSRPKGWRATPLVAAGEPDRFGVSHVPKDSQRPQLPESHVALGLSARDGLTVSAKQAAYIAQEVRSPFAGTYTLNVEAIADCSSRELYDVFVDNFACRLVFFQFTEAAKQATSRRELASLPFTPPLLDRDAPALSAFSFTKGFFNPNPGSNFSFGLGLGVAVMLEKTSAGSLTIDDGHALLKLRSIQLTFDGKQRNENVTV